MTDHDAGPSPATTRIIAIPARMIPLADGRAWGLALPTPRYRPEVITGVDPLGRPTETIRLVARFGYPPAIERSIADLRAACSGASPASDLGRFEALMALAVALLRRAHDLTLIEAVGLLDLDGDGLSILVDAVLATVTGSSADSPPASNRPFIGGGNA